jgi:hypothetical protein
VHNFVHISANQYMRGGRKSHDREVEVIVLKEGPTIPPGPGRKLNWMDHVIIPHIVPSGLGSDFCPCIKVSYELLVIIINLFFLWIIF